MPKYIIQKQLVLEVEVEAKNAQAAYDAQLHMDDTQFTVLECDYQVSNEEGDVVEVNIQ